MYQIENFFFCPAAMVDMSDRKTGKKKMREKILQEGTPLPDLGTCEHYKKSHRWLRFASPSHLSLSILLSPFLPSTSIFSLD